MYKYTCMDGSIPIPDASSKQCTPAKYSTKKTVSGVEIDYGFWTRNIFHDDSYADLWAWDHGGNQPSPTDLASITDAQAIAWFNAEYMDYAMFSTYPPTEVQTNVEQSGGKLCFSTYSAPCGDPSTTMYSGIVTWPDGSTCTIEDVHYPEIGTDNGCVTVPIRISIPCSHC